MLQQLPSIAGATSIVLQALAACMQPCMVIGRATPTTTSSRRRGGGEGRCRRQACGSNVWRSWPATVCGRPSSLSSPSLCTAAWPAPVAVAPCVTHIRNTPQQHACCTLACTLVRALVRAQARGERPAGPHRQGAQEQAQGRAGRPVRARPGAAARRGRCCRGVVCSGAHGWPVNMKTPMLRARGLLQQQQHRQHKQGAVAPVTPQPHSKQHT
jgi:hypothetical protein